ncbi:hypothetical protein L211DRAFT_845281 [Terfezia boudieri ATCC MYA-4762]|uniref:Uncharacterized protein n=1 Tax=Terfezia boudieri ATCC MYA-4762 TaxID=1051890 RepID=A0A3N4LZ16_9PEZI|nr:hypothetical protein L211DRAFT_845281 [Terfezia boudieri ATCC MYA-4762]
MLLSTKPICTSTASIPSNASLGFVFNNFNSQAVPYWNVESFLVYTIFYADLAKLIEETNKTKLSIAISGLLASRYVHPGTNILHHLQTSHTLNSSLLRNPLYLPQQLLPPDRGPLRPQMLYMQITGSRKSGYTPAGGGADVDAKTENEGDEGRE